MIPLPAKPVRKKPPGRVCATCAKRVLGVESDSPAFRVFQLKLRDWLNVERVDIAPCLSVCPSEGMTVERRGKTQVLDQAQIESVESQFDPTRQLSFLGSGNDETP